MACSLQVLTYTNHALDQFLLGLVAAGVENLVRVGGRNKSPELEPFSLIERAKEIKSRENKGQEWDLRRCCSAAAAAAVASSLNGCSCDRHSCSEHADTSMLLRLLPPSAATLVGLPAPPS